MKINRNWFLMAVLLALPAAPASAQLGFGDIYDFWRNGRTFHLPLTDGSWAFQSDSIPTFSLKFSGTLTIEAPTTGTFRVLIEDLERPTADGYTSLLDREVRPDEQIPFTYDTGRYVRLRMRVEWSDGTEVPRSVLSVHITMG